MKDLRRQACLWTGLASLVSAAAWGQGLPLRTQSVGGRACIRVADLADCYRLDRGRPEAEHRITYRNAGASLVVGADHREILLDGVQHWLSMPVQWAQDALWIGAQDVRTTIDPVLRPRTARAPATPLTVILDPGHGGIDNGTHGAHSREKDLTIDVATRVTRLLAASNIVHVQMTRRRDETTSLAQRVDYGKAQGGNLYVSIHFNAGGTAAGIETYCVPPAGATATAQTPDTGEHLASAQTNTVCNNTFDESNVWLAHCVQRSLLQTTQAIDRGVRRARFYVLRNAACPAILVEAGFLSNRTEEAQILTLAYRKTLARSIANGILTYAETATPEPRT